MSHKIEDLRNRLFDALDALADKEKPMEIERAKAIADVARVIVDSAKAEIQFVHATGGRYVGGGFIPLAQSPDDQRRLAAGAGGCPKCGGRLRPETDGDGKLVDRCVDCGQLAPKKKSPA